MNQWKYDLGLVLLESGSSVFLRKIILQTELLTFLVRSFMISPWMHSLKRSQPHFESYLQRRGSISFLALACTFAFKNFAIYSLLSQHNKILQTFFLF